MSTKKLKAFRIVVAILSGTMGITSLIYDGISFYHTIHHNYTTAVMYIGISIILGIVFLVSCNLYDVIIAEIKDRKYKCIQRKIHRAGGDKKVKTVA